MEAKRFGRFIPLILFLLGGLIVGAGIAYIAWGPAARNYAIISTSKEATRAARVDDISVTYPLVIICKAGEDISATVEISNLDKDPRYVVVSLSLVRSNGVDSGTISSLTANSYRATIAAYGSANHVISFNPSSNGYAIFDITVNGELVGNIALYIVPSP